MHTKPDTPALPDAHVQELLKRVFVPVTFSKDFLAELLAFVKAQQGQTAEQRAAMVADAAISLAGATSRTYIVHRPIKQ